MTARRQMEVAARLVEDGQYTITASAAYASVSREGLSRRLERRRLERLAPRLQGAEAAT